VTDSKVYKDKVTVYELSTLALSQPSEVHIEVNSGTFSMGMLEQCINN